MGNFAENLNLGNCVQPPPRSHVLQWACPRAVAVAVASVTVVDKIIKNTAGFTRKDI